MRRPRPASTLKERFEKAIQYFWKVRDAQEQRQGAGGGKDAGQRAAVTGGGHCRGFADLFCQLLVESGIPDAQIYYQRAKPEIGTVPPNRSRNQKGTELPGYFRATKDWDLIEVAGSHLVASIELKSQIGPSFGNNFNNRTEEALGNALDLWEAYRVGAFKPSHRPWLGYFMLLEDCEKALTPVRVSEPHFPVFPEFRDASYAKRYEILCERLVRERLYNAACFVLSSRDGGRRGKYREPNPELGVNAFVSSLMGHSIAFAKLRSDA